MLRGGGPSGIFGGLTEWVSLCGLEFAAPASLGLGLQASANTTLLLGLVLFGFFFLISEMLNNEGSMGVEGMNVLINALLVSEDEGKGLWSAF